jgi:hypothetical protein
MTTMGWIVLAVMTTSAVATLENIRRHVVGTRFVRLQRMVPR